ncbi:alpha,alpha-trehalose-phosphate synthase (UDP-forming) [Kushneria aurantia]|uniref:Trehalose-6-phosphate synthase n=1 Tax=Kushneria aurantia TaxID=504092 RepID=A0ABV6G470_9GAMM|nr:trehalose-6-phosphate synthase [Kushneria aurantia]
MKQLIVVSNRVPSPQKDSGSQGGLAVGVMNALSRTDGLWMGWNGVLEEDAEAVAPNAYEHEGVRFATFPLTEEEHELFYVGYSNEVLWPLLHYRPDMVEYSRDKDRGYQRVNQRFADQVADQLEDNDDSAIWVHDYQLLSTGHFLRTRNVDCPIGFFLHIPMPPWETFRILPRQERMIEHLCAYDTIGVQTETDLEHLLDNVARSGVARVEGHTIVFDGRRIDTGVFPISIDVDAAREMAERGAHSPRSERLKASLRGGPLIIGVDRLDYSKGIYQRFRAFEQLLENTLSRYGNITYLQIAPLSRTGVERYAALRHDLERIAGHVNGRFSSYDWMPLRYLNTGYDRETLMGFMRQSRVALVTPLRDGMNLVAKEYVAAQDPQDPGVLMLSSFAGAAEQLDGAMLCNPFDVEEMADMLDAALSMSLEERKARWQRLHEVISTHDIHRWGRTFVEALNASAAARHGE